MARKLPIQKNLIAYRGSTHSLKYAFADEDGSDIDLDSNYPELQLRIFKSGKEEDPEVDKTKGDGISILNTNELVTEIAKDTTKELFGQVLWYELRYTLADDSEDAWFRGRYIINNVSSGGEEASSFDVTYNTTTDEVQIESSSNDAAAAANSLAQTQDLKDSLEWKGAWASGTTYKKDHRVSYQGEAFISLQDSNQGNAPVGDSGDSFWDVLIAISDIDFTGLQQADILRHDGSKLVRENEADFLQKKDPFKKSVVYPSTIPERTVIWDNFIRGNSSSLGTADSGHEWKDLVGDGFSIQNSMATPNTSGNISYVDHTLSEVDTTESAIVNMVGSSRSSTGSAIMLIHDSSNYLEVEISQSEIIVTKNISDALTQILSLDLGVTQEGRYSLRDLIVYINISTSFGSSTVSVFEKTFGKQGVVDISADNNVFGDGGITKIGIKSGHNRSYISSFSIIDSSLL